MECSSGGLSQHLRMKEETTVDCSDNGGHDGAYSGGHDGAYRVVAMMVLIVVAMMVLILVAMMATDVALFLNLPHWQALVAEMVFYCCFFFALWAVRDVLIFLADIYRFEDIVSIPERLSLS